MRRRGPGSGESLLSWNSCMPSTSPSCALNVACPAMPGLTAGMSLVQSSGSSQARRASPRRERPASAMTVAVQARSARLGRDFAVHVARRRGRGLPQRDDAVGAGAEQQVRAARLRRRQRRQRRHRALVPAHQLGVHLADTSQVRPRLITVQHARTMFVNSANGKAKRDVHGTQATGEG